MSADNLCQDSVDFLLEVWSPELGLFPYSTSVRGGAYVNDYSRPAVDRYTVNTLLGLQEPASAGFLDDGELSSLTDRFLERRFQDLTSLADLGLLLVLLKEDHASDYRCRALDRLLRVALSKSVSRLDLQTLSWVPSGAFQLLHHRPRRPDAVPTRSSRQSQRTSSTRRRTWQDTAFAGTAVGSCRSARPCISSARCMSTPR